MSANDPAGERGVVGVLHLAPAAPRTPPRPVSRGAWCGAIWRQGVVDAARAGGGELVNGRHRGFPLAVEAAVGAGSCPHRRHEGPRPKEARRPPRLTSSDRPRAGAEHVPGPDTQPGWTGRPGVVPEGEPRHPRRSASRVTSRARRWKSRAGRTEVGRAERSS
jgi:hypothetical protein